MHCEASVLGNVLSDWSELTEEYMAGMEALRRREPGASARMMEIAKLMSQYQQIVNGDGAIPTTPQKLAEPTVRRTSGWLQTTATMVFGISDRSALAH